MCMDQILGTRGKVTVSLTFTSLVLLVLHHVNSEMCWKLTNFITFTDGVSLPQYIESNVVAHKVVESLFVTDGQRQ